MSIVRHGRGVNTQYRQSDSTGYAQQGAQQEAQRRSFMSQDARRCAARAAQAGGWTPAELREVLDMLGLLISPAQFKALVTRERRVRAGTTYRGGNMPGVSDVPKGAARGPR